ncbi:MAG: guanylate kinase [Bacteriovoracaceae bacterium]|nr:guanylate kinase [Bacteriovoracaceae bacterium]
MPRGRLIVIVAPSGTGKSTLIDRLKAEVPELKWSVSCTTRPIREGEVDGVNYYFLDRQTFSEKIADHDFIEWAVVHSNFYGTSKEFTDTGLKNGVNMLFDLDVQGADAIKRLYPKDSAVIFIEPPSVEDLLKRLKKRGTDPQEVIDERVRNAKKELLRKNDFDYLVMNDEIDKAYAKLKSIILKEMGKSERG